jgi:hypothetical protein
MRGNPRSSGWHSRPGVPGLGLGSWGEVVTVAAPDWHDELELMAELSSVNNQIARFVLRLLDADAGRTEQVSVADEGNLGVRLVDLGYALQDRAVFRATGRKVGVAIEVPGSRRQLESGRKLRAAGD